MLVRAFAVRIVPPLSVSALVLFGWGVAQPMMVVPMSLARVTKEAHRIARVVVVDVQSGRDAGRLPATWVTVDTVSALKGHAEGRMVIKQYGVAAPLPDGTLAAVAGLPKYAVGDELVLFLRADSGRGFTSPVGLGQGVYRITYDGSRARARSSLVQDPAMDLDKFLAKVATLVASRR